jgi:DNA-binding CsgD family transcriptional regulator/tetratricopeptide (TPR) repeat protein
LHSHFKESQLTITDVLSQTAPYQVEPKLRAEVLQGAGVLFSLTDYPRARAFQQENLELRRKIHDEVGAITALIDLGWLALHQADFPQAAAYGEEGLNLARKLANKPQVAAALFVLSIVTLFQGDNTQAELYAQECLSIWQELGDQGSIASGFLQLGTISLKKGEYINARTRLVESLNMYLALGNKIGTISVLGALAELAMYHRSAYEGVQKAAVLLGAVESIRASLGFAMPPLPGSVHDARLAMVQSQLDPPTFSTAFHEGGRLELKEILALAQEDLELSVEALFSSPALDSSSNHSVGAPYPKAALNRGLTPREIEVLKLAATGVTTLKIAEELTVSPLTVQAHLRSIYSKLEVTSRSAATRYALENKLV